MPPKKWADVRGDKKPRESVIVVPNDDDDARALEEADVKARVARARLKEAPGDQAALSDLDEADEEMAAARAAIDANCTEFHLRALPREEFEALVDLHPPTSDQQKRWRKENPQAAALGASLRWNGDSFPPALIAKCCVDPEMDEVDAKDFWSGAAGYSQAEVSMVLDEAVHLNTRRRVIDLGKGSKTTPS